MSNLNSIKMASCMLECAGIKGSGFFITPNLVLTCLHNLSIGQQVTGERPGAQKETFEFEILDQDAAIDLALLKVLNDRECLNILHVCSLEPVAGIEWESYGYPDTNNGRTIGESLTGDIRDYAEYTAGLEHDVFLNVTGYNVQTSVYDGFSGSPLVDDYGNVVAVFRFSSHNSLDAVSIKRARPFLEKNNILCKQDYLLDFEEYASNCFAGFEEDPKRMCNTASTGIRDQVKPDSITRDLLGKLYYPHNNDSLEDIIAYLKKNPATNRGLWKGWLELLSYLSMIPSARTDFNSITITLSSETFKELFGTPLATANDTIDVKINFFWTQGQGYLTVINDYAHNRLDKQMGNNTCYIFNSADPHFGRRGPKPGFKKGIVMDIGGEEEAGMHIIKQMNFGMLSLNQLSQEVLECDTVAQARPKIKQLFINALQND